MRLDPVLILGQVVGVLAYRRNQYRGLRAGAARQLSQGKRLSQVLRVQCFGAVGCSGLVPSISCCLGAQLEGDSLA
ncbi:hypothetical protein O71_02757 [Pontibacter sp. BAB1700]|nr:hypothetical protein O71_02757 [Pontibacter sp. BAB1700]